jgi:hypothetical protein
VKPIPKSPCTKVCSYDTNANFCIGCGRASEEITEWLTATKDRKIEIIKSAKKRLKK